MFIIHEYTDLSNTQDTDKSNWIQQAAVHHQSFPQPTVSSKSVHANKIKKSCGITREPSVADEGFHDHTNYIS